MKRKIFSQISLLIALFAVAITVSACSNKAAVSSSNSALPTYSQSAIQNSNIPSPQTRQS